MIYILHMNGFSNDMSHHQSGIDRVWFVTGASKGIGRHVTEAVLDQGGRIIAGSRSPEQLARWAADQGVQDRVVSVEVDVTDESSVAAGVRSGLERFGRIDVLVNNAGYLLYGGIEELSDSEVRRSFDVNVFGLLNVTRAVLKVMREQSGGRIINMASISANVTSPTTGLYSATKAAVLMLTEALAEEGKDIGVDATAICPGGVNTDFLDSSSALRAEAVIDAYRSVRQAEEALQRTNHQQGGDPRKVADAIIEVAGMEDPPHRLYLGEDALKAISKKYSDVTAETNRYRELSLSTTA